MEICVVAFAPTTMIGIIPQWLLQIQIRQFYSITALVSFKVYKERFILHEVMKDNISRESYYILCCISTTASMCLRFPRNVVSCDLVQNEPFPVNSKLQWYQPNCKWSRMLEYNVCVFTRLKTILSKSLIRVNIFRVMLRSDFRLNKH